MPDPKPGPKPAPAPAPVHNASAMLSVSVRLTVTGPTLVEIDRYKRDLEALLIEVVSTTKNARLLARKHGVNVLVVVSDR